MAMMKCLLEDRICQLAEASGYDEEHLMELWFAYCDGCQEDGEAVNWDYFAGVTMEHDW